MSLHNVGADVFWPLCALRRRVWTIHCAPSVPKRFWANLKNSSKVHTCFFFFVLLVLAADSLHTLDRSDQEAENAAYANYIKQLEEEESAFQNMDELEKEISEVHHHLHSPWCVSV